MGEETWTSYAQAATTAINAQSTSDDGYQLSSAIDNSSNKDLFADIEASIASVDLSGQTNPAIYIWIITRFDGTNFSDGDTTDGCGRAPDAIIPFNEGSGAEAKRDVARMVMLPPEQFKILAQNKCGATVTLTIKYRTYGLTVV